MTSSTTSEVQFDHKQWFHDIDRWNFYLQVWQKQIAELTREYRRLQQMAEQYADDLEDLTDEVGAHRNNVLNDERALVARRRAPALDEQLVKRHETNTAKHAELYKTHERLQQTLQTLSTGLAVMKHEPIREE